MLYSPIATTSSGIMSQFKTSAISHTFVLLLFIHGVTYARSMDSQNDDLKEYLGRIDEKVRTLMSILSGDRALPPLPVPIRKDLPNVHPWRSLDEPTYGQFDQWQEKLLARHRQQQQQQPQSSSDYSNDQQILKQISREVDKITLLVKSLNHPVDASSKGGRASRYRPSQDQSSQDITPLDDDRIVEPERPWRGLESHTNTRKEELRHLLQDLDRTLKIVENFQSDQDAKDSQKEEPVQPNPPADSTLTEDNGELELMKLLAENSNQGVDQQKDDETKQKVAQPQNAAENTDHKAAVSAQTQNATKEANEQGNQNQSSENKEAIRKSLTRLMADMKDLEERVSSSNHLSQTQQLHDRILQLAEKLGNPPR